MNRNGNFAFLREDDVGFAYLGRKYELFYCSAKADKKNRDAEDEQSGAHVLEMEGGTTPKQPMPGRDRAKKDCSGSFCAWYFAVSGPGLEDISVQEAYARNFARNESAISKLVSSGKIVKRMKLSFTNALSTLWSGAIGRSFCFPFAGNSG
jgi:hypothetical protein